MTTLTHALYPAEGLEGAFRRLMNRPKGSDGARMTIVLGGHTCDVSFLSCDDIAGSVRAAFVEAGDAAVPESGHLKHRRASVRVFGWDSHWIDEGVTTSLIRGATLTPGILNFGSFRVHVDRSSGVITALDSDSGDVLVLLRRTAELDPRAFITPFRIALAWISDAFGGEILHASCVQHDALVLAFIGSSGSGKSTVAHSLAERGWSIIADDALLACDGRVFPIYQRVKGSKAHGPLQRFAIGKSFSRLPDLRTQAFRGLTPSAFILVGLSGRFGIAALDPNSASARLTAACLPEIAGGLPRTVGRIRQLAQSVPTFLGLLGPNTAANALDIEGFFADRRGPG